MTLLEKINEVLIAKFNIQINRHKRKNKVYDDRSYQFEYIDFQIKKGESVIDIGSGSYPFRYATHLVDLFSQDNFHRGGEQLVRDGRPLIIANIDNLPYGDNMFDFVYCSHVLEHAENPAKACQEIMRVGKRGYIETPTRTSDIMFNFAYIHKWHILLRLNIF